MPAVAVGALVGRKTASAVFLAGGDSFERVGAGGVAHLRGAGFLVAGVLACGIELVAAHRLLLEQAADPEQYYREVVMQDKLRINSEYIADRSFFKDIKIIFLTFWAIVKR